MPQTPPIPRTIHLQRAPEDITVAVDAFLENDDNSYMLFIIEQRRWEEQLAVITQARATTLHNRVLIHRSKLSPIGISTLVDICYALAPQISVAQLLAACEALEQEIACFAHGRSAAKLTAANPSLWQHLTSWWPKSTFVARAGGQVMNSKKLEEKKEFLSDYRGWVQMAQNGAQKASGEVLTTVQRLAQPSSFIEKADGPSSFWGTPTITEWCFAPADIAGLVTQIQNQSQICAWCQEPFASSNCPVCSSPSLFGGTHS